MLAVLPLVAATFDLPLPVLPRQTQDVCAAPPDRLRAAVKVEADRIVATWQGTPATAPLFMVTPGCAWRCDDGPNPAAEPVLGVLRHTCRDSAFQLGMNTPDRAYHDATHGRFGGRMMKVPDALIRASLEHPTTGDFKKELARHGWKYVEFTSTSVPNLPNGYGRVLVLIETDDFDQWLQIATADTQPRLLGRNVDLAVVQKRTETGQKLGTRNFYFNGYSRFLAPKPRWEQEGLGAANPLNRCIMCHPSGLRGIFPLPGSVAKDEEEMLKYIQKKLDGAKLDDFGGYYDLEKVGPPLGPVDPPGRDALVARCGANLGAASRAKVARAMNCASCHDGKFRGILNTVTDWSTIHHKIVAAVPEARMPPAEDLSIWERAAVSGCLRLEYAEQLRSWAAPRTPGK